jgi:hypothetical protein
MGSEPAKAGTPNREGLCHLPTVGASIRSCFPHNMTIKSIISETIERYGAALDCGDYIRAAKVLEEGKRSVKSLNVEYGDRVIKTFDELLAHTREVEKSAAEGKRYLGQSALGFCTFCGNKAEPGSKAVAGASGLICATCALRLEETLNLEGDPPFFASDKSRFKELGHPGGAHCLGRVGPADETAYENRCCFCGNAHRLLGGPSSFICENCLRICLKVIRSEK